MHASNKQGYKTFLNIPMMNMQDKEAKRKYNETFFITGKSGRERKYFSKASIKRRKCSLRLVSCESNSLKKSNGPGDK